MDCTYLSETKPIKIEFFIFCYTLIESIAFLSTEDVTAAL